MRQSLLQRSKLQVNWFLQIVINWIIQIKKLLLLVHFHRREHFHCLDCHPRVFVKKEEMIRHFKWHKKRDESLQHGFMRYSPSDDCNDRYRGCPHNHKQTHYHCVKVTFSHFTFFFILNIFFKWMFTCNSQICYFFFKNSFATFKNLNCNFHFWAGKLW